MEHVSKTLTGPAWGVISKMEAVHFNGATGLRWPSMPHLMDSREPYIFRPPTTARPETGEPAICRRRTRCRNVKAVAENPKQGRNDFSPAPATVFFYSTDDGATGPSWRPGLPPHR